MSVASCTGSGAASPAQAHTEAPAGVVSLAPATADVNGIGATYAAQMTVSEANYASTFTETDTCSSGGETIATVSPVSGPAPAGVLMATITGMTNGKCSVTWRDAAGHAATSSVYVTTSSFAAQ